MDTATSLSMKNTQPRLADSIDMDMFKELGYPTEEWSYVPELITSTTANNPGRNFWRRKTNSVSTIWLFWHDDPVRYDREAEKRQMSKRQLEIDAYTQAQVLKKHKSYQEGMALNDILPIIEDLKATIQQQTMRIAELERRVCETEFNIEKVAEEVEHRTNPYNKK